MLSLARELRLLNLRKINRIRNPVLKMSTFPFDRKVMEEERLARVAARKKRDRSISPPPSRSPRKAPKLEEKTTTFASGAKLNFIFQPSSDPPVPLTKSTEQSKSVPVSTVRDSTVKYPRGVVLRTWAFGYDRCNDVKIEEVLEPSTLRTAVLSAFQWDVDWVFSKLKTPLAGGTTKCVFIMEAKERALRKQILGDIEHMRSFVRVCFPPMDGVWCMHSKLMLLFHPTKLRVAIPTANLLNFDWGETGMMENSVFMIDLPRLPKETTQRKDQLTAFGQEILFFAEKQGLEPDVRDGILNFDFSTTAEIAFVHSVGGTSYKDEALRTGLLGLHSAVRSLDLATTEDLEIDFAASSIGSLKDDYLRDLHASARGVDLSSQLRTASSQAKKSFFQKPAEKHREVKLNIREKLRIYFPTHETVKASRAGGAGTICLQKKWFDSATFPRSIFRDYVSTRPGLLSHNKILIARGISSQKSSTEKDPVAWAYVGSANASMSAWGTVSKDGEGRINCRNWECGVLLPACRPKSSHRKPVEVKTESAGDDETESDDGEETKVGRNDGRPDPNGPTAGSTAVSHAVSDLHTMGTCDKIKTEVNSDESETESDHDDKHGTTRNAGVHVKTEAEVASKPSLPSMDVFKAVMNLPFEFPGTEYGGRQPWYFDPKLKARED